MDEISVDVSNKECFVTCLTKLASSVACVTLQYSLPIQSYPSVSAVAYALVKLRHCL